MPTVDGPFAGKPDEPRAVYGRLVALAEEFGPAEQNPKETSIHLNRRTAFADVAVREAHLVLTIRPDRPRIIKSERTSAWRFPHEVNLASVKHLDAESRG
jgi:hypothetical protein